MNRVRTVFLGVAGAPYYSNHYFTDDSTSATAQNAVDAVDDFWTAISGNMDTSLTWTVESNVARIDEVTGDLTGNWSVTSQTGVGQVNGELLPRATQGLVRWLTNVVVAGRLLRGRTFVPGVLETLNDSDGNPVAGLQTILTTAGQALIADAGCELIVWSRTHGTSEPVVTAQGWDQWAVLRSRRD